MPDDHASTAEHIFLLCPTGRDAPLMRKVLQGANLPSVVCADLRRLCAALEADRTTGAAVVAEEALVGSKDLDCLLETLKRQPVWSDLPLVVLTSAGGPAKSTERLAASLEPVANVIFLERPVRVLTLVSTLRTALRARRRQHQVRDLLAQAQEQLRQRDRFLALLGHELRNPLAAVRTAVEVLENIRSDDEAIAAEQRRVMVRQTGNLARLVDDLLDVARITAGKITLNRQAVDLAELVRQGISSLRLAVRPLRQRLSVEVPDEPVYVEGDPVRLEQIVTNLVGNAIKYTHEDGTVRVSLERDGDQATIEVRDNGIGIPGETLPHIFEPFYRVDSPQSRIRGGLGLGLAVVRGLVDLHKGTITAHSDGPGRGSRFTVRLPLTSVPGRVDDRPEARPPVRAHRSVLVVEDAPDARGAMTTLLKLWGHRVDWAEDGYDGVRLALECRPDVALVDIGLPGIDGYEVARQIRSMLGDGIQLIALTGYGQAEDRRRALEAGFNRHLVKPVDPRILAEVLVSGAKEDRG